VREFLTDDRFANSIRQQRSIFFGVFLLVEGSTDKILYERFTDREACAIVCVSGKPSSKLRVIAVLNILENSKFEGILAIVDADFDRLLESPSHHSPNLLCTDTHDLETMTLKSDALEKVLAEFGSEEKIKGFNQDIRATLLEAGMSIGYLRWISQSEKLNLKFEGITFSKFIDERNLKIDETKLIQEIKNKSQAHALKTEDLLQQLTDTKNESHDRWQVCCGHDLVEILSLGLCKAIGTMEVEPRSLETNLRLAYEEVFFFATELHSDVQAWEADNQPFRILRKLE
jgi:hypothetical protein